MSMVASMNWDSQSVLADDCGSDHEIEFDHVPASPVSSLPPRKAFPCPPMIDLAGNAAALAQFSLGQKGRCLSCLEIPHSNSRPSIVSTKARASPTLRRFPSCGNPELHGLPPLAGRRRWLAKLKAEGEPIPCGRKKGGRKPSSHNST
jgi:hypothetical protein